MNKNNFFSLILVLALLTSCSSCIKSNDTSYFVYEHQINDTLNNLYHKNQYLFYEDFNNHCVYNKIVFAMPETYKKVVNFSDERFYNFLCCFSMINLEKKIRDIIIAECNDEEQAIDYQKFLNDSYVTKEYSRNGKFVYLESFIAYLVLYGKPLEKEGFLYYELENGESLLFGDSCVCKKQPNTKETLEIPEWVTIVGAGAPLVYPYRVHNPSAKTLIIPDGIKEIKQMAFSYSIYENVILPSSLETINSYAFDYNEKLKYVVIPKNVKYIGERVFSNGKIFCEAKRKPDGWNDNFAVNYAKVYYANEWKYDENGVPQIK